MFFRRRRPSLLYLLLALLGLGFLCRRRHHRCKGEERDDRRSQARRKFREGFDILFGEDEPAPAESPKE